MKRWHVMNYWRWYKEWKGFIGFNVYATDVSVGLVVCNFGLEYLRAKFFEPWKSSTVYQSVTFPPHNSSEMMPKTRVSITK